MVLEIRQEPFSRLDAYAQISTVFDVHSVFDVEVKTANEFVLHERLLATPYQKDYDSISDNHPMDWANQFDLTNWCLLAARHGERWAGGAIIAWKSSGMEMLMDRDDLALLWDLRVNPDDRRHGVASALFAATETWAKSHGCRELKVETQNINVPACRFYASQGCRLQAVHPETYREFSDEIQFLWFKKLN